MSHGVDLAAAASDPSDPPGGWLFWPWQLMQWLNRAVVAVSMLALVFAAGILTYGVFARYLFKISTDWQDEACVFLLVGATFLCGAHVQSRRGHVGIEVLASILPARINAVRLWLVDLASLLFCGFFTWKSHSLLFEAVHDGQTSSSTWAPPLWIPYGLMTAGMALLSVQIALQLLRVLPHAKASA